MRSVIAKSFCIQSVPFSELLPSDKLQKFNDEIVSGKYILALQSDDFEFRESNRGEVSKCTRKLNLSQLKCFRVRDIAKFGSSHDADHGTGRIFKFGDHEHFGYMFSYKKKRSGTTRKFRDYIDTPLSKEYMMFISSVFPVATNLRIL